MCSRARRLRAAARSQTRVSHALPRRGRSAAQHPCSTWSRGYFLARCAADQTHHRRGVRAARRPEDAGAAWTRGADCARPSFARRASRHRTLDGCASVYPRTCSRSSAKRPRHASHGLRSATRTMVHAGPVTGRLIAEMLTVRRRSDIRRLIRRSASALEKVLRFHSHGGNHVLLDA